MDQGILDQRTYMNRRRFLDRVTQMTGRTAAEGVAVDHQGNVYGAEVGPKDLKRYVKR